MRKRGASAPSGSASHIRAVPLRPTPHRVVVSLALALFLPALWLVLIGNLSVQTALVRFIGALVVSWVAAWLVVSTTHHSTGPSVSPADAGNTPASTDPASQPVVMGATELTEAPTQLH